LYNVEVIYVGTCSSDSWADQAGSSKLLVVLCRSGATHSVPFVEMAELYIQDGSLNGIQPAIHTHKRMLILGQSPVVSQTGKPFGQFRAPRSDRSAIAVGSQILAGVERKAADIAE